MEERERGRDVSRVVQVNRFETNEDGGGDLCDKRVVILKPVKRVGKSCLEELGVDPDPLLKEPPLGMCLTDLHVSSSLFFFPRGRKSFLPNSDTKQ